MMSETSPTLATSSTAVRWLEVAAEYDGQRIDNFLQRVLKGVPKSRIYRLLRKGEVRVNKGRIPPSYRLQQGDVVRIPPLRQSEERISPPPPETAIDRLEAAVLWEDEGLVILNKPAGVAVHAGSGVEWGVIELLRQRRTGYLELGHRLDRETSGCLALAKTPQALQTIHQALQSGEADKRYWLLVKGGLHKSRRVEAALRKNALRGGERMVSVDPLNGKAARTDFTPLASSPQASLLEAVIATGRTHQIRVHAAHLGYPVAGDEKYGDAEFNRQLAGMGLKRLFLHAHRLTLPWGQQGLSVEAPLEPDLVALLDHLGVALPGKSLPQR